MSDVRRLFAEAGRAQALLLRLESSLQPAQRLASSLSGDRFWRGTEAMVRLSVASDPFAALEAVLDRMGVESAAEEREPRPMRRLDDQVSVWRIARSTPGVGPAGRLALVQNEHAFSRGAQPRSRREADVAPDVPQTAAVALKAMSPPADNARQPLARAADGWSGLDVRVQPTTVEVVPGNPVSEQAPSDPYIDPSRAAAILTERLRVAHTLDAFRSVIRVTGVEVAAHVTVVANSESSTTLLPAAADGVAGEDGADGVVGLDVSVSKLEQAQTETVVRTSDAPLPPRVSGLRRLAALATEALDSSAAPIAPVQPGQPAVRLEDELDRVLRAEAIANGIDVEGVR